MNWSWTEKEEWCDLTIEGHITARVFFIGSIISILLVLMGYAIHNEQVEKHRHLEALRAIEMRSIERDK